MRNNSNNNNNNNKDDNDVWNKASAALGETLDVVNSSMKYLNKSLNEKLEVQQKTHQARVQTNLTRERIRLMREQLKNLSDLWDIYSDMYDVSSWPTELQMANFKNFLRHTLNDDDTVSSIDLITFEKIKDYY